VLDRLDFAADAALRLRSALGEAVVVLVHEPAGEAHEGVDRATDLLAREIARRPEHVVVDDALAGRLDADKYHVEEREGRFELLGYQAWWPSLRDVQALLVELRAVALACAERLGPSPPASEERGPESIARLIDEALAAVRANEAKRAYACVLAALESERAAMGTSCLAADLLEPSSVETRPNRVLAGLARCFYEVLARMRPGDAKKALDVTSRLAGPVLYERGEAVRSLREMLGEMPAQTVLAHAQARVAKSMGRST
jgi:hypothetical protein